MIKIEKNNETINQLKDIKNVILQLSEVHPLTGIAKDIGIPYNTLWYFVYIGERVPRADNLNRILDWWNRDLTGNEYVDLSLLCGIRYYIRSNLGNSSINRISIDSGIPYTTLYNFVTGKIGVPRPPFIRKIVRWYNRDVNKKGGRVYEARIT